MYPRVHGCRSQRISTMPDVLASFSLATTCPSLKNDIIVSVSCVPARVNTNLCSVLSSLNTLNVVPTIAACTGGKTKQSSLDSSARLSTGSGLPEAMPVIQTRTPGLSFGAGAGLPAQMRDVVALISARDGTSSLIVPRKEPVAPSE